MRTVTRGPARGLRIGTAYASAAYADGTNELPVQRAVVGALRRGDTFFDIGANVGFFSLIGARAVGPSGKVVAFEAVPEIAACISVNFGLNALDNVSVHTIAIGASVGTATLHLTQHPGGATIAEDPEAQEVTGSQPTPVTSIDALCAAGDAPIPDVVKVDVEGHELAVLTGMVGLLAEHGPKLIIELDGPDAQSLVVKRHDIVELLATHGYDIEELDESYIGTDWAVVHLMATRH